ncbi:balbiani ring protein 3-like [Ischnura elegans]|uniref:balbiani ring protein 3-like n=1 Tax=Ischnura elegans TaxID=197161 RepID=UPI001ED88180|nr:balbiani ring protein 3-like [Ischnura elegans]
MELYRYWCLAFFNILPFACLSNALKNDEVHLGKRYAPHEKPHVFEEHAKCSREFMKSLSSVMMESNCMPRQKVVQIISHSTDTLIVPSKVVVNRCDGMCHAKQSCLATEMKEIPIVVQQLNLQDPAAMPKCGVVYVEEHLRCKCQCTVMKEHCNEKQDYQPGECMCLCMNDDDRRQCLEEGKQWDDSTCSCQCPLEQECSTGEVWVHKYCSCAKLMGNEIE